ncbi:hypothetical protein BGX27_003458 [Mortierella sp. AM989]|nr:hypothetical protein BGX27_003458 [Mortierella sp. AM989]
MFRASLYRSGKRLLSSATCQTIFPSFPSAHNHSWRHILQLDTKTSRVCYSTTSTLFRKYEGHYDHINIKNPTPTSGTSAVLSTDDDIVDHNNQSDLLDNDDLMVDNDGLETIDPKDFPDLYPDGDNIEGVSQESRPDNESDVDKNQDRSTTSVLLSDKERSEEEFSWFVDGSYPEGAAEAKDSFESSSSTSSSDFVPLWQKNAQRSPNISGEPLQDGDQPHSWEHSADSISGLVALIESERAKNVKVIDMREKCDWTEWMVIAEGLSERHLGNVADQVYSALKKSSPKTSPPMMEGRDTPEWIVIDAGSVVIHFMTPEARKERDLEGLWASVKNPLKIKDVEEISWDDVKSKMTKSWKENTGRSKGEDGKRGRRGEMDIPLAEVVKW